MKEYKLYYRNRSFIVYARTYQEAKWKLTKVLVGFELPSLY